MEIITLAVAIVMLVLSVTILYAAFSLAPWVPTRSQDLERINHLARLKSGQVFYEVGCGTAIVSSYIAKKNPDVQVIGIELAIPLYVYAKLKSLFGPKNFRVEFGDALRKDYSRADVVYIFGLPKTVNGKLKEKLEKEFMPGAKFISYTFDVIDWKGKQSWKDKPTEKDSGIMVCVK